MGLVVPAVLPSSRADLAEKLERFAKASAVSRIQIDVVDGRFAIPGSWPYTAPEELRIMVKDGEMLPHLDRIAYEIDLMCFDAARATADWLSLGASRLTFHVESILDVSAFLETIRRTYGDVSATFGLAVNITSDLALIKPYVEQVEYIQFMGIASIGKQGQIFDPRVLEKIREFRAQYEDVPIQVDGGVTLEVAKKLIGLDVSNLVIGSALLRVPDLTAEIEKFESMQNPFGV